jgi:hypothetical protein
MKVRQESMFGLKRSSDNNYSNFKLYDKCERSFLIQAIKIDPMTPRLLPQVGMCDRTSPSVLKNL